MMAKKVTISFDEDVIKKLRILQAKTIKNFSGHVSFSQIVNENLRKSLK
ncbi:hypothetical protein [Nitrosopumilus zosterae]|nr:hypothetical protein [Nitrosopumilus zosterae]BDQ31191.1 hypothetical protein NZOSNM25_001302 [Nitrosopumilus zosterae]